jgi:hypothetical protein
LSVARQVALANRATLGLKSWSPSPDGKRPSRTWHNHSIAIADHNQSQK